MVVDGHSSWTTRRGSNPRLEDHQQILLDIHPPTPTADTRAAATLLSPNILTAAIILSWYLSNIGVLLLNKYLLSYYGFRYPIFLTLLHMLSCSLYSLLAVRHLPRLAPPQPLPSNKLLLKILSLSFIFSFSVVCGNTSLRYLPVSFNQAVGATTPFFTAVFSVLITCKKESKSVYLSLLPVVFGIVIATNSEPSFHLLGFLICVGSTAGRALKSVIQGLILTSDSEKLNSMNLLLYMAPMAAAMLLPVSVYVEGNVLAVTVEKAREDWFIVFLLVGNATVAYLVNLVLTLRLLGNAKVAEVWLHGAVWCLWSSKM